MKLNKDDIYGIVGSVAFHLFILLILGFTVLKTVVPDEDGGILVNFGNVPDRNLHKKRRLLPLPFRNRR